MTTFVLLFAVAWAIVLEVRASPRRDSSAPHIHGAPLRRVALTSSLLLLFATLLALTSATNLTRAVTGGALIVVGGWVRALAMRNLGSQFRTEAGAAKLVTTGIHGHLRHPSELGLFAWMLGLAVAATTELAGVLLALQLGAMYVRVRLEDAALERVFGRAWATYATQTRAFGLV